MGSLTQPKLPVINFSEKNLKPGTNSWLSTRNETVRALEEFGCFVAVNDRNTSDNHGYIGPVPAVIPLYESLGIENATTLEGAQKLTNVLWPSGNDFVCETVLSFSKLASELDQTVKKMVSESYGIQKYHEHLLGSTCYLLKPIKYREPKMNETNLCILPHTDNSFFTTILH
ncbi:deoxypodophyllotoxin synthase-like [Cornus florida]|uniref:deoxypodophyllotoxin synthase-like n=1 Tax=Cornus florida TaxID=4283 RepID=UPI0028978A51|nr:deoxypodophyllotoxin synthase-like [Cornus florida]